MAVVNTLAGGNVFSHALARASGSGLSASEMALVSRTNIS